MKKRYLATLLGALLAADAQATLFTFDDLGVPNASYQRVNAYQGFNFYGESWAVDVVPPAYIALTAHSGGYASYPDRAYGVHISA